MKKLLLLTLAAIFFVLYGDAQPLPCPPIVSTTINGWGDTTICKGACATIGCTYNTSIKSTSEYIYSTIPYLPTTFTGPNAVLVGIDDTWSNAIPLPFPFCFYGAKYNQCWIGANGQVSFTPQASLVGGSDPWPINGPWPTYSGDAVGVQNCIMGAYYDIDPSEGGTITWAIYGSAPCRTFVVSWNNVPLYNSGFCPGLSGTEQIVLYESTYAIDIFIHQKPSCTAWNNGFAILGICDATGTNYNLPAAYNGTVWSVTDAGFRFTPNGAPTWNFIWTDPSGAVVGTSPVITVCPEDTTIYQVEGIVSTLCNDSFKVYSSVTVNVGPNPTLSAVTFHNPTRCALNDGSITLHGLRPGISDTVYYKYEGVLQPFQVQVPGADSLIVLNNLCQGTYDSIVVKVGHCHTDPVGPFNLIPPPLTVALDTIIHPSICDAHDGSIRLKFLIPGLPYALYYDSASITHGPISVTASAGGKVTISGLGADVYSNIYLVLLAGPCTAVCNTPVIGPFTLINPPAFHITIDTFKNPSECGKYDGTIILRAVTPYTSDTVFYSLDGVAQTPIITTSLGDSTIVLPGLHAGTYSDFSVKIGTCYSIGIGACVLKTDTIKIGFDTSVHYGCHGDSVYFNNSTTLDGHLYYVWKFGDGATDTVKNPMHIYPQGTYTVTLIATNHFCIDSTSMVLPLIHPLKAGFVPDKVLICQHDSVTFTDISTGTSLSYAWSAGDGSVAGTQNLVHTYDNMGYYTTQLVVTDWVPCRDTAKVTITVDTISGIQELVTDSVLCSGTYVTFTGLYASMGNTGVAWNISNGDSILNVNPLVYAFSTPGVYTVSVTARYRVCPEPSASRTITVVPQPVLNLGPDRSICPGSEAFYLMDAVNAGNPEAAWLWNTGATGNSISITSPGVYFLTVTINNCHVSDSVTVANDCYLDIPNVFSPNGDGVNDYFLPRQLLSRGLTRFKLDIYNRWGQLVFETSAVDGRGWDGKFNNVEQPEGVYIYVIEAAFKDGQKEHRQGNVTLIR